jgi:hypothetical protein
MMSDQTLAQRVRAKYPGAYDDLDDLALETKVRERFPGVYDDLPTTQAAPAAPAATPAAPEGDSWGNALSTLWHTVNPLEAVKMVAEPVRDVARAGWQLTQGDLQGAGASASHALEPLRQLGAAHGELGREAVEAAGEGDYLTAARKGVNYLLLGVGPALDQASEDYEHGKWKTGTARTVGIGANLVAPAVAGKVAPRIPAPFKNKSAAEREAVAFGESRGIPVDAGTATGNRFVRGTQAMADHSLGGSMVAEGAQEATAQAFTREGQALAGRAHANPVQLPQAGAGVRGSLEKRVEKLGDRADTAYTKLRQIENAPTSTRQVSQRIPTTDAQGNVTQSMVSMDIQLPVDLKTVKAELKPLRDALERQMPMTQRQASPGLQAINNILDAADYLPATMVDADLSALKALARSKSATPRARGLAKHAVEVLEAAVEDAVAQGGPAAVRARTVGRAATAAKYNTAEILKALRKEPGKATTQLLVPGDMAIEQLRTVARVAPQQMPALGRAYLERLLAKATKEGRFEHADWMQAEWQKLGPQTKKVVFKDAALVKDLDDFFLLAKMSAKKANPSGTATTIATVQSTGGALSIAFSHPVTGAAVLLGPAVVSKLLHSRAGVRALTQGLSVPVSNRLAASTAAARLLKLAGEDVAATSSVPRLVPLPAAASDSQEEP